LFQVGDVFDGQAAAYGKMVILLVAGARYDKFRRFKLIYRKKIVVLR